MPDVLERSEHDSLRWFPRVTVERYSPDQSEWAELQFAYLNSWRRRPLVSRFGLDRLLGRPARPSRLHGDWLRNLFPRGPEDGYGRAEGNLLVAGGLYSILGYLLLGNAASGANGRALTQTQTGCGVGSSATPATVGDVHLGSDGSAWYQQMDLTYPANAGAGVANGGQVNGQVTVSSTNGNFNWQEWCWFTMSAYTAASASLASVGTNPLMLNHWEGTSLGTKGAGATYVFSTTLTIS